MKSRILILLCHLYTFAIGGEIEAIQFYKENNYKASVTEWQSLLAQGKNNSDVHYNLALCYQKLEDWPRSILHLETALKLNPHDAMSREALKYARHRSGIEIIELPPQFIISSYFSFLHRLPPFLWFGLAMLFFTVAITLVLLKKSKRYFFVTLIGMGFIFLMMSFHREKELQHIHAAIVMQDCKMHQSPDTLSPVILSLTPGIKLTLKDRIGTWIKCETDSYESGWLPASEIAEIK